MTSNIQVTPEQKEVLANVAGWLKQPNSNYITIGGYAGTGKTTLTAILRRLLYKHKPSISVAFCSYTGKAARILATTLKNQDAVFQKDSVSTIHSLIYAPVTQGSQVVGWKKKEALKADLVIVDEASMVDRSIWADLTSFRLPIIAVGDHGQLPPVGGSFNLIEKPDLKLETIHRQVAESPIIKLSILAREEGTIPCGNYGRGVRKLSKYDSYSGQEVEEMLRGYRQELMILAGYNNTRIGINKQIRAYRDFEGLPQTGDQVICLKNNQEKGIYNGMVGRLQRIKPITDESGEVHWYDADIYFEEEDLLYAGKISAHQFHNPQTLQEYGDLKGKALGDLFDFGYALTVHKAQGSQAPKVLLFEERFKQMDDENWRRWLYTAVTRAQEYLTIVGEPVGE